MLIPKHARFGNFILVNLLVVFAITWMATRVGFQRKLAIGMAEKRTGRNGAQVLANLAPAALLAIAYPVDDAILVILAEVAADTVASEIGQAFGGGPRLITTMRRVPTGSNGGVTWLGSAAGAFAAAAVIFTGFLGRNLQFGDNSPLFSSWSAILVASALAGMFFDSFLGATLEGRILNNNAVNFLSASLAGLIGIASIMALRRL